MNILSLIAEVIGSFHVPQSFTAVENKGTLLRDLPLGNLTSQLLVNVYMNKFDQFVKHKLKAGHYVRYADDFVVLSHDKMWLKQIGRYIALFLRERLKLELHPDKVFIKTLASGIDCLGWAHFPDHRVLRTATKWRMFRNLRGDSSEEQRQSYRGLLLHGNAKGLSARIDQLRDMS